MVRSVCAAMMVAALAIVSGSEEEEGSWYTRYSSYPEYCSTPAMMASRSIPALEYETSDKSERNSSVDAELLHVTAVIRHGARTPWSEESQCWKEYWSDPVAGVWNCSLLQFAALAPSNGTLLFQKRYDALSSPPRLANALNGTCQIGQLIAQGYRQHVVNGHHLRDAYFRSLFSAQDRPYQHVYFRSDEDQRTTMSGQALLQGLFSSYTADYPTIPLHLADRKRDIMAPNPHICPRLHELRSAGQHSKEFEAFNSSHAELYSLMNKLDLKISSIIDCLMTTICTDRPLPRLLNDYHEHGEYVFERLLNLATVHTTMPLKHNKAAYSKLAMAPLWANILDQIRPHLQQNSTATNKLSLFSGHDDTIMPLLASLGEHVYDGKEWTPYASMLLIEIYNVASSMTFPSGKAFRLLYNGRVLTSKMDDCDHKLCDVSVLFQQVEPFATIPWDCDSVQKDNNSSTNNPNETTTNDTSIPSQHTISTMNSNQTDTGTATATATLQYSQRGVKVHVLIMSCLLSAALASFATYFTLTTWKLYGRVYDQSLALEEENSNSASLYGAADPDTNSNHVLMT